MCQAENTFFSKSLGASTTPAPFQKPFVVFLQQMQWDTLMQQTPIAQQKCFVANFWILYRSLKAQKMSQKKFISEIPDYFSASENQCTVYARFSVIVGHPTLLH